MRGFMLWIGRLGCIGLMLLAHSTSAAGALTLRAQAGSRIWLEGNSTAHKYSLEASKIQASVRVRAASIDGFPSGVLEAVDVSIPVQGLRSSKKGMQKKMLETMRAAAHPTIRFTLARATITKKSATTFAVAMTGTLTVAGKSKSVNVAGTGRLKNGKVEVSGSKALTMTQFGMKPPTALMGSLKTDDRVVVRYRLTLGQ